MEITDKVFKISKNTDESKREEENSGVSPDKGRPIHCKSTERRIIDLHDDYLRGDLIPTPSFQRGYVWDRTKASRLIESVFLNVPLPLIYTAEEPDAKEIVIDGHQRLVSFFSFREGKFLEGKDKGKPFKLGGLKVLNKLNGSDFQSLDRQHKKDFERYAITVIGIQRETDPNVKFDIFERLNKGSMALNDQEIRNCVYWGTYNDLLKDLANNANFQKILSSPSLHDRMLDAELVLRFFAFYHNTHLKYKSPMKHFLNIDMEKFRNMEAKAIQEHKLAFNNSVDLVKSVFGDKAFRRFIAGDESDKNGKWEPTKVNRGLFDVLMFGFTQFTKNQVMPHADSLREEMLWLMTKNVEFKDSISGSGTDNKPKIQLKFDIWIKSLRDIIGYPSAEPRCFSSQLKKQLYDNNPTCDICHNNIQLLDDAEVHHIEHYWRGGKNIESNASLVHRYCNRSEGGGNKTSTQV